MQSNSNIASEIHYSRAFNLRASRKKLIQTGALFLIAGSYLLPGVTMACGTSSDAKPVHPGKSKVVVSHAKKNSSPVDLDYFQSSDNPMRD